MTNSLKFYRQSAQPTNAAVGAIWFDVTNRTIQVKTNAGWEPYAGKIQDVTWNEENQTLTISKHDGSSKSVNLSDVASASAMAIALNKKLNIGTDADEAGTPSYHGLKKDIAAAAQSAQNAAKVKEVDTTATNGINLSLDADGKLDVTVTPGAIAEDNGSVVTGGDVYQAIEQAKAGIHEELVDDFAAAKTEIAEKSAGHVKVSKSKGADGQDVYTIAEDDIASAQDLSGVDGRVAAIEAVMGGDDADTAINKVSEIITFLNGIEEGTVAKDTFEAVTAHGTAITNLQNNTVNGKKISENPVLAGSDVLLTGYTKQTAAELNATDSINVALGKLETRVDAAAAAGVKSVGGKTGDITLDTHAGNGNVKFAISEAGEISATVYVGVQQVGLGQEPGTILVDGNEISLGLGTAAFTNADAYAPAAQGVKNAEGDNKLVSASFASNKVTVAATDALTSAVALANSAVQSASGDAYVTASVTDKNVTVAANIKAVADASATSKGLAEASDVKAYVDNALCWVEFE